MAHVHVKMVGRCSLWKLETECPAQGHLHIKYFKTFYWPNKAWWVCTPAMQANSVSGKFTGTGHAWPLHAPQTFPAVDAQTQAADEYIFFN